MGASWIEESTPVWRIESNIDDHRRRYNNSSKVEEIFSRGITQQCSGITTESPARTASSSSGTRRHPNAGSRSNFEIPEDFQGGYEFRLNTNDDERRQKSLLPSLQQPYRPWSPLSDRPPSVQLINNQETFGLIPSINPLQFYQQRKEMISRHHWKLTNQDMTSSNAQRCIRMLTKHHSKLEEFIRNLTNESHAEPQLKGWLISEHGNLLHTSRLVLTYFELCRMHLCR